MSQQSQIIAFSFSSPSPRAWLVVKGGESESLVLEMQRQHPNVFSANVGLNPGQYSCRYYCGDQRNVSYHGPASIDGGTNDRMDSVISVQTPAEVIRSDAISILLVEDDHDTLGAYAKLLRADGHTVHTADGYQSALDVARRERVDLAVCDIGLWDGSGSDLLKELQKLQPMQAIAVTGFSLPDEVEDYRAAGFASVLPKPLQHSRLRSAVSDFSPVRGR
jgi:CheY-like chemotaxis protein